MRYIYKNHPKIKELNEIFDTERKPAFMQSMSIVSLHLDKKDLQAKKITNGLNLLEELSNKPSGKTKKELLEIIKKYTDEN